MAFAAGTSHVRGERSSSSLSLLLLLVIAAAAGASPYSLDEGDPCVTASSGRGECRRVSECLPALDAIRRGARATARRCGFLGWEEIVCCPFNDHHPLLNHNYNPLSNSAGGGGRGRKPRPNVIGGSRITQPPQLSTTLSLPSTAVPSTAVPSTFSGGSPPAAVTKRPPSHTSTRPRPHTGRKSSGKALQACERYRTLDEQRIGWFILGGEEVSEGEFPHMVALGYLRQGQKKISWRCGGTLISEVYVLTAAHCLTDKYAGVPKVVRVGEVDLRPEVGGAGDYRVESWALHPRYKRKFNYDDVALLRLAAPVAFTQNARPACLSRPQEALAPQRGELIATGWGATEALGTAPSPLLLKTNVSEVPLEECRALHRTSARIPQGISNDMLCAGDPRGLADTCVGDSGGPLQILEEPRSAVHTVVGITSFGPDPCGGKKPGVYVRVANYVPWIESVVWPTP